MHECQRESSLLILNYFSLKDNKTGLMANTIIKKMFRFNLI